MRFQTSPKTEIPHIYDLLFKNLRNPPPPAFLQVLNLDRVFRLCALWVSQKIRTFSFLTCWLLAQPFAFLSSSGVCSFCWNCVYGQILWSLCSVDFHTIRLQLPIQTVLSVAPELHVFVSSLDNRQNFRKTSTPPFLYLCNIIPYPEYEDSWKSIACCAWLHIHNVLTKSVQH